MNMVPLGELMPSRIPSVNPSKHLDETFELWSIPAFDQGEPERLNGSEIGSSKKCVEPDDVLLSRIVPHIRRSWVVGPLNGARQIASGEWITFRSPRVFPQYLRHVLISDEFHAQFMKTVAGVGGSLLRARPEGVKQIEVPLPPLDEQKRIAAILDQADALRRLRQRALDRLNTLGLAIFHEMFGDDAEGQRVPLGDVIDVRSSLADPKLPENQDLSHVGPEHISSGSGRISWERVVSCQEDGVTSGKYIFEEGDIIYSKIRPYLDKVAIADRKGMCSADMYALNCKKEHTLPSFVHFALGTSDFLSYAARSSGRANIPKINRKQLLGYPIPLPSLDAQREFEMKIQKLEEFRRIAERHSRRTESLFASLQSRAFRGEL